MELASILPSFQYMFLGLTDNQRRQFNIAEMQFLRARTTPRLGHGGAAEPHFIPGVSRRPLFGDVLCRLVRRACWPGPAWQTHFSCLYHIAVYPGPPLPCPTLCDAVAKMVMGFPPYPH